MNTRKLLITSLVMISSLFNCALSAEYYVSLRVYDGHFVSALGGGGGPPGGNGTPVGRMMGNEIDNYALYTKFIIKDLNGGSLNHEDKVTIRVATNGLFVSAEYGGDTWVNANRVAAPINSQEEFTIIKVSGSAGSTIGEDDYIAFKVQNGKYICAENGGGSYLIADRAVRDSWETFRIWIMSSSGGPYWTLPELDPTVWNDFGWSGYYGRQQNNNCYNFGANRVTNTFAQPGRKSGMSSMPPPFTLGQI